MVYAKIGTCPTLNNHDMNGDIFLFFRETIYKKENRFMLFAYINATTEKVQMEFSNYKNIYLNL